MEHSCKLTYVSNAGVMLQHDGNKILIDSLCDSMLSIYKNPSDEVKELMISGVTPFENVDALLFTHNHTDHFDAESTVRLLKRNINTFMLAPQKVVMEVKQRFPNAKSNRFISLDDSLGKTQINNINGINIQSISMIHDGKEYEDVGNLAYLVDIGGKRVLHIGDAKPIQENYIHLELISKNIDLLIAPFPYIGLPSARQVIKKYINPRKIAAVHLPYRELDSYGWINATMKSYLKVKENFIETVIFENPGECMSI